MNPGLLLIPYLLVLAYLVAKRHRYLVFVWVVSFLVFPTTRNKFGPVSIYWCDVAALATAAAFSRFRGRADAITRGQRWMLLLLLTYSVGMMSAVFRYNTIVEPGYWVFRTLTALIPFLVIPRLFARPEMNRMISRAFVVSACSVGVVVLLQAASSTTYNLVYKLYYGSFPVAFQHVSRLYGMYYHPNNLAGASVLIGAFTLLFAGGKKYARLWFIGVMLAFTATLLTYSRHGLLAMLLFFSVIVVLNPRRLRGASVVILLLALFAGIFVSFDYWAERIGRGGVRTDENLRVRFITRPIELLNRLQAEPDIGLIGAGLGVEHSLEGHERRSARFGFVSNTYLLYLFFCGFPAFCAFLAVFLAGLRKAIRLPMAQRAPFAGAVLATVTVLASDNYAFYHTTFPFLWSFLIAVLFTLPTEAQIAVLARGAPGEAGGGAST